MKSRLEGIVERRNSVSLEDIDLIGDLIEECRQVATYRHIVMNGSTVIEWAEQVNALWGVLSKLFSDDGLDND